VFRRLHRRLPPIGRWPRLLLAGCCLMLALLSAVSADPAPAPGGRTTPVVVAARRLPAGHVLARRDVVVAHWLPETRPVGAAAVPGPLLGRRLAGPVGGGEPVTPTRLIGADLAAGLSPGSVAAAVTLGDPHAADLVRAGDRIDLLATGKPLDTLAGPAPARSRVRVLAADRLVLAVLPATTAADAELVLAVDRASALRITRDSATQLFTAVVVPP
jgi:Flp pilus assembly protein CpaB